MIDPAHHDGSPLYVSDAAPALGERISLRLRTHVEHQPLTVALRLVRDGEPQVVTAEPLQAEGCDVWWSVDVVVPNPVMTYRWMLAGGAYEYGWLNARGLFDYDVPDADDFVISTALPAPDWGARSVVYQVFPDRFARRSADDQEATCTRKYGRELPDWAIPRPWSVHPEGRSPNTGREFFGGDLDGVAEHLDHIEGLGANVVYLTPVFPAGSTHRYDSTTFAAVDPLLGGQDALARLVRAAHERSMRVLGDITLNHCGVEHEWFVRAQDPQSVERGYFRFDPDEPHGYRTWLGVRTLPKFDLSSPALQQALVSSAQSPIRQWLHGRDGLDGWRVDVANMAGRMGEVDVAHEIARQTRAAMALEREDLLLVAEHGHDASGDLLGDGWHGTMNYAGFTRQVWSWLRDPSFTGSFLGLPIEVPIISGRQFVSSLRAFHGRIPWRSLIESWNILGSHDTARIRTVVGSPERQIAALALAVGLPGVPMVFAGDEIGATGLWGEDSRTTFPWDRQDSWDHEVLAAYTELLRLRRDSSALATGGLRWVCAQDDAIAFVREHPLERILVAVSRGQTESLRISMHDLGASDLTVLHGHGARVEGGHAVIELPGVGAGFWRLT